MAKVSNTKKYPINLQYFQGGTTVDPKLGIANSFYKSRNLDFRTFPSQMSVLPDTRELASNLTGLITAVEQDLAGVRWAVATDGSIYRLSASDVVSKVAQLGSAGAAAILYNRVSDQLYIPGQTTVSMYGQVTTGNTGNPVFRLNQFAQSASNSPGCTNLYNPDDGFFDGAARSTADKTYTVPIILNEGAGNFCFFAPDIEPFYSIKVYIVSKGTGNWTLTLHDSLNNRLAAVTIANASLTNNAFNEFVFSGQIRALVNASQVGTSATYHFHLTSTVGDGTASVVIANDLSSCNFLLYAYRLVQTQNGWHPAALFTGSGKPLLCMGNGPYLSTYDFSNDAEPTNQQWQRHTLTFEPGDEVCGLSTNNQYLVMATERRSSDSTRNFQKGSLYFWSGTVNAPDFKIDIPMGAPYGLSTINNITYFCCAGSLFAWSGGQTVIKVRRLAYQNTDYLNFEDNTIVNPNMLTSRYNLLMIGYPSSTTDPNIDYGVWSWGAVELMYPNSYGQSYTLSNGQLNYSTQNNLQIGCVVNFVDDMYISWRWTTGGTTYYGLDKVDNFSIPAATAHWESLIYDGGVRYKMKRSLRLKISFLPLPASTSVTAMYSRDRGAWVDSDNAGNTYTAVTGETDLIVELNNARFHEIQWGFDVASGLTATEPVTITGITMEIDPLVEEINDVRNDG